MNKLLDKLIEKGVKVSNSPERFEELVCSGDYHDAVFVSTDGGYSFQSMGADALSHWGWGYEGGPSYADWARRQGDDFLFLDLE